jgi:hypothetical protein
MATTGQVPWFNVIRAEVISHRGLNSQWPRGLIYLEPQGFGVAGHCAAGPDQADQLRPPYQPHAHRKRWRMGRNGTGGARRGFRTGSMAQ